MSTEPPYQTVDDPLYGNPASDLLRGALEMNTVEAVTPASGRIQWQPPTAGHLAEMLPGYQVLGLIGRGGMGAVYRGVQISLGRPVAIKLLPAELAVSSDFVSRFQREAQTLARLQHPGIVAVHDFGRTAEGHLFFIMEFVDGTDLQRIIHGPGLEPDQALNLTLQICEALQYAHSHGVVHRDIKPANVLLTQDGRAKLADFGLARPLTATPGLTAASMIMGSPEYMAPEQWAGKVDHRADIYALGVMLYEMLTGTRPQGAFDLPSAKSRVDARLDEVIVKAMRQAPEQRFQHVSELRDAVQRIRITEPPHPAPEPAQAPQPSIPVASRRAPVRRRSLSDTLGWAAVVVVLLAVIAALAWVLKQGQGDKDAPSSVAAAFEDSASAVPGPPPPAVKPAPAPAAKPAADEETVAASVPQSDPSPAVRTTLSTPAITAPPPAMPAVVNTSATSAAPAPAATALKVIDIFTREAQNLIAWALAPLEEETPAGIRQNLIFIREDLIDEGKTQPAASLDAYRAAYYLCEDLLTALNERDQSRAAAGYRNAQAAANQPASTQALDARRNYLMSWPQHAREQSQRSALNQQNAARTAVAGEAQKVAWTARVEKLRDGLDARYRAFRAALRQ